MTTLRLGDLTEGTFCQINDVYLDKLVPQGSGSDYKL